MRRRSRYLILRGGPRDGETHQTPHEGNRMVFHEAGEELEYKRTGLTSKTLPGAEVWSYVPPTPERAPHG